MFIKNTHFVFKTILRKFALDYATHHPTMGIGHPNCPLHPEDYFKDGVTNGGLWDSHEGSMMVKFVCKGYVVDDNGRPIANASIESTIILYRSILAASYQWKPHSYCIFPISFDYYQIDSSDPWRQGHTSHLQTGNNYFWKYHVIEHE
uniref:Uncharacterized protein n=1 Tax=Timema monikensis TaxID=170555 RepID=A0A7R9E4G7_9NEOP|nr:unnamed protein product [Timema monikensis]